LSLLFGIVSLFLGQLRTNEPIRFNRHVSGGRMLPVSANKAPADLFRLDQFNGSFSSARNKVLAFLVLQLPFFLFLHSGFKNLRFP
jgi:hypothetical protein